MRNFTDIPYEKCIPTLGNIVVKILPPPEKVGTMIMPDSVKERHAHSNTVAEVISMGPMAFMFHDGEMKRHDVAVGDMVVFAPYSGAMFERQGAKDFAESYRIIASADVLAIIRKGT